MLVCEFLFLRKLFYTGLLLLMIVMKTYKLFTLLISFSATSASIKGLEEGQTTQFRVRGVNAAGLGEPSKPTDKIKIEDQPEKPE